MSKNTSKALNKHDNNSKKKVQGNIFNKMVSLPGGFKKQFQNLKGKGKDKNQESEYDIFNKDKEKRNYLHRACLEQDEETIEKILVDYEKIQKELKEKEYKMLNRENDKQQEAYLKEQQLDEIQNQQKENILIKIDKDNHYFEEARKNENKKLDKTQINKQKEGKGSLTIQEKQNLENEQKDLKIYINAEDRYGCTPLWLSCVQNYNYEDTNDNEQSEQSLKRFKCLKKLIDNGADINKFNPSSGWYPMHWCAFYGDIESINLLLENKAISFVPDRDGQYPFELAAENEQAFTVRLLILKLTIFIPLYLQYSEKAPIQNSGDSQIKFYNLIRNKYDHFITSPILYQKMLYWACYFHFETEPGFLKNFYKIPRVYLEAPLFNNYKMTPLHALAKRGIAQVMKELYKEFHDRETVSMILKSMDSKHKKIKEIETSNIQATLQQTILHNDVLPLVNEKHHKFSSEFQNEILDFQSWETHYLAIFFKSTFVAFQQADTDKKALEQLINLNKIAILNQYTAYYMAYLAKLEYSNPKHYQNQTQVQLESHFNDYINVRDAFGNTPLHLASSGGFIEVVNFLIKEQKARIEQENHEAWTSIDLAKNNKEILKMLKEEMEEQNKNLNRNNYFVYNLRKYINSKGMNNLIFKCCYKEVQKNPKSINQISQKRKNVQLKQEQVIQTNIQDIDVLADFKSAQLFLSVPDFIFKCNIQPKEDGKQFNEEFFSLKDDNSVGAERLNFQIQLLKNQNFIIYLMKSYYTKGDYYVMIDYTNSQLEEQAEKNKMPIKLIDSFILESFDRKQKNKFEPFRSRQRQEIIENDLRKILNFQQLQLSKLISQYFRMHSYGGIQKIRENWLEGSLTDIPQPLKQIFDFIGNKPNQKFQAITTLRLYFGEKIGFYFAWKSYMTCILLFLAIPGTILQCYIFITGNYFSNFTIYWIIYSSIWSSIQLEFWKRKTNEICARWGTLELNDSIDKKQQKIRDEYKGYEEIDRITNQPTKHSYSADTFLTMFGSIPVLVVLLSACVFIFVVISQYTSFYKGNQIIVTSLGIIQGISITFLNFIYSYVAKYFADLENHKYQKDYEKSLIYKNAAFKFLNSYLAIIYTGYFQPNSSLENVFNLLLPVLIVKQANYLILSVLLPQYKYMWNEYKYFQQMQIFSSKQKGEDKEIDRYSFKSKFYKFEEACCYLYGKKLNPLKRQIIKIQKNEQIEEEEEINIEPTKDQQQIESSPKKRNKKEKRKNVHISPEIDADQIELNSLKEPDPGLLNYFMESMIDQGYITLFAAAFAIGPLVALIINIIEIRLKIFSFLHVYQRPQSEKSSGIGEWLNIQGIIDYIGVFSNVMILYIMHSDEILTQFNFDSSNQKSQILVFGTIIGIILVSKIIIQTLIPSVPYWVKVEKQKLIINNINKSKGFRSWEHFQNLQVLHTLTEKYEQKHENLERLKEDQQASHDNLTKQLDNANADLRKLKEDNQVVEKQEEIQINLSSVINVKKLRDKGTYFQEKLQKAYNSSLSKGYLNIDYYQFLKLERFLLTQRLKEVQQVMRLKCIVCFECNSVITDFICNECDLYFCVTCFDTYHKKIKSKHSIFVINASLSYHRLDFSYASTVQILYNNKRTVKELKLPNFRIERIQQEKWFKFQQFKVPNQNELESDEQYKKIQEFFKQYYEEDQVIKSNEIKDKQDKNDENNDKKDQNDLNKEKEKEDKSQVKLDEVKQPTELLKYKKFNIEELIFLNKIYYFIIRVQIEISDRLFNLNKYFIKQFLQGNQKLKLRNLLRILDERSIDVIDFYEFLNVVISSFIQHENYEQLMKQIKEEKLFQTSQQNQQHLEQQEQYLQFTNAKKRVKYLAKNDFSFSNLLENLLQVKFENINY